MKPLISICIPTYNGSDFIAEAMDSAIAQTYTNLEIIVSDDNSKDNTLKIIESYKEKTTIPISIYNHQPNGIGANWNNSVKKANGVYIKFLFQDDILMPTCIERMVDLAINNDNVGLVYCKREILHNANSEKDIVWIKRYGDLHTFWCDLKIKEGIINGKEYLKDNCFLNKPKNKIGEPPAVLLKKECFKKVGYFNTRLSQALDLEYWYRLMPYYNIAFIDEELIKFRLHNNQASQVNKKRNTKDKKLLPKLLLKSIFIYLQKKQKRKLLKEIYHNTLYYHYYKRVKSKIYNLLNA